MAVAVTLDRNSAVSQWSSVTANCSAVMPASGQPRRFNARRLGRVVAVVGTMMHRAGDVLAGAADAWLRQQVGDAGASTQDEAELWTRRAAEEAEEEGSALSAGPSTALMRRAGDVLAGVTDARLLQQVGDAGDSTEDEAEFTARRAAEEAE